MKLVDFLKSKLFFRQLWIAVIAFGIFSFIMFKSLGWITNHSEKIEVPDLSKKSMYEVDEILDDMDLRFVVQDSVEYNPEYPINSVIKQNPKPGDIVKSNRKIYLTINAAGYRVISIPEFQGKTKRVVESTLKAIGFEINSTYMYVPDIGKDVVRGLMYKGEKIEAGDKIPKKSVLTLVLGEGTKDEEIDPNAIENNIEENPEF